MSLSYEYAVGSVRAKETKLLSNQDMDMLAACKTVDELVGALSDKGFNGNTVDEMLENRITELWSYVGKVSPDMTQFDLLLCRNDLHNIKAVIKGVLSGRQYKHLLISPSTVSTDDMIYAIEQRKFDTLPEWMSSAAAECYELTARQSDARLGDAVIDRTATEHILALAKSRSAVIADYYNAIAFYANVKIALRSARSTADSFYLGKALSIVEGMDNGSVIKATLAGEEELLKHLKKLDYYGCSGAIEAYAKSPSDFERYVDDRLMQVALACRYISEGIDPLFGYIIAIEAENKAIHIIKSGIATGRPQHIIRERLRRLYG